MVQVDLITGFLGAGKTTFLRRYVRYLVAQGHNVCILENDFGAVNVDAMLVQDLLGPNCDLETISGGCDCDTHQRRMRTIQASHTLPGNQYPQSRDHSPELYGYDPSLLYLLSRNTLQT